MKPAKPRRRIVLADLLILIGAIAVGLAVLRATLDQTGGGYFRLVSASTLGRRPLGDCDSLCYMIMLNGIPQVLLATLWVVMLSLKAARTSGSQVLRGPGFVLSLTAVSASILTVIVQGVPYIREGWWGVSSRIGHLIVNEITPRAGLMVLGSWMALALVGRGRAEPTPLDRLGYALGMSLIGVLGLESIRYLLEYAGVM
jgi:hypothetical protein